VILLDQAASKKATPKVKVREKIIAKLIMLSLIQYSSSSQALSSQIQSLAKSMLFCSSNNALSKPVKA
jgi:hypothetical protein